MVKANILLELLQHLNKEKSNKVAMTKTKKEFQPKLKK
jgi:hypothetical protein